MMKKLISLLLALMMLAAMTTAAFAEGSLAYAFTLDDYKATFDMLAVEQLGVTPEWTEANGVTVAKTAGYTDVEVYTNAAGNVTALQFGLESSGAALETDANNFGMMVSLTAMTALMLEDPTFVTTGVNTFMSGLAELITTTSAKAESVPIGQLYSDTRIICGSAFTLAMGYGNTAKTAVVMQFTMAPAADGAEAPAGNDAEKTPVVFADAFSFLPTVYQNMLQMILSTANRSISWSQNGQVLTGTIPDYPAIVLTTNEAGQVAKISVEVIFNEANVLTKAQLFGESLAYASMTALLLEDASFASDNAAFQLKLMTLVSEVSTAMENAEVGKTLDSYFTYGTTWCAMEATNLNADESRMVFTVVPIE